ncbi:hypothetical protein P691DRAFT_759119 [Macrolepiota fuliginosa MF-IS2]|uniref:Nephrocystin 3-like N-terminal domain-containing protein n=1 Tax=Macrolepiota fuliginosa MF-IS2 TaxID=1400762 RepID=A0A9P5XDF7_9AGAR|nr:hypothetical protein P691DRAFT_759119 [Macrolepiota fuliginosa MF-IS2]
MSGVEYHSSARDPPPRCYDGTRAKFITMVEHSLSDSDADERLLLLSGPAGVGKSAILQTLAERREQSGTFGASLFFPRSTSGDSSSSPSDDFSGDSSRIWLTISYRLATLNISYATYVNEQMRHDPKLVEANMQQQFKKLIAEPCGQKRLLDSSRLWPIFIDGLDQCQGYTTPAQILQLIGKFISDYPSSPLLWIITSRPDRHLLKTFDKLSLCDRVKRDSIPVDSDDALADVKHFLRSEFVQFQDEYDITDPSPWPKEDDFGRVHVSVSGYFMVASAISQFVGNRKVADPVTQLETVVSAVSLPRAAPKHIDSVHEMYRQIIGTVHHDHYRTAKRILGFYLLPQGFGAYSQRSTSFSTLCNLLDIKQNVAYACLSGLLPVLVFPEPKNAFDTPMRFFHTSFAEFLINRDASKEFWIDVKEVVDDLWECHCRIIQQANVPNIPLPQPNKIKLAWPVPPEEAQESRVEIWRNAQRVFLHQLLPCPVSPCAMKIHHNEVSAKGSAKRIDVLRTINFSNLVDFYTLPDVPYRLLAFLDWLVEGEDELIRHNLWEQLDLAEQGFNWIKQDGISFRINVECAPEGGSLTTFTAYTDLVLTSPVGVRSEGLFSTREPPASFSQLLTDLASHKGSFSTAIVVGSQAASQCAILVDNSLEDLTVYYVLPCIMVAR